MTEKEYIINWYPKFIEEIKLLSEKCFERHETDPQNKKLEWFKNKDIRFDGLDFFYTAVCATKIGMDQMLKYVSSENFETNLRENIISNSDFHTEKKYLKELDTQLRFSFFHQTYHCFESSVKVIIRHYEKNINSKTKIQNFIIETLKLEKYQKFLKILSSIRNGIHNNGFFFPDYQKDNVLEKSYNLKTYNFNIGERIDLKWGDAFFFFEELMNLWEAIIYADKIIQIKETIYSPTKKT